MTRLASMLRRYRQDTGRSVRHAAAEMGIPPATLSRAERNSASIGADTFVKLMAWMLGSASHERDKP